MKLSNTNISSCIISYSASKLLILKRFDGHNEVILFLVTIFVVSNWVFKVKMWGCNYCTPALT